MVPQLPPEPIRRRLKDSVLAEYLRANPNASVADIDAHMARSGYAVSAPSAAADTGVVGDATRAVTPGAPERPKPTAGQIAKAFGRGFGRSATLGTIDEAAGVVGGVYDRVTGRAPSLVDAIRANTEAYRADTAAEEAAPGAASFGGMSALATPLERVAGVGNLIRTVSRGGERLLGGAARMVGARGAGFVDDFARTGGRLAGEGAVVSGLEGAASAEGGPAERLLAGLRSAGVGAGLNSAVGGVGLPVAGAAVRTVVPGLGSGRGRAVGLVGTAAQRDVGELAPDAVASALRQRVRGVDVGPVAPEILPRAVIDAGENITSLGTLAAKTPGPGRERLVQFAEGRQRASANEATDAIAEISGVTRSARETVADITKIREQEAAPLWEAFRQSGATARTTDALGPAATGPEARSAWSQARKILSRETRTPLADIPATLPDVLTPEQAHAFKMGLDDIVADASRGNRPNEYRQLTLQQQDVTARLAEAFPGFAEANNAYAGASALANAAEEGASLFRGKAKPAEAIRARLSELTEAEREVYRESALAEIAQQMRGMSDGRSKDALLRNENARQILDALVPESGSRLRVDDLLETLRTQGQTDARILGGSPTAPLGNEADDVAQQAAEAVLRNPTNPAGGLGEALLTGSMRRVRGIDDPTSAALADLLTARGPEADAVIDEVTAALRRRVQDAGSVPLPVPGGNRARLRTARIISRQQQENEP